MKLIDKNNQIFQPLLLIFHRNKMKRAGRSTASSLMFLIVR